MMSMAIRQSEQPGFPCGISVPAGIQPENALQLALYRLAQLQDEAQVLRQGLLAAGRATAMKEALLRNALRREMELRAQLVREISSGKGPKAALPDPSSFQDASRASATHGMAGFVSAALSVIFGRVCGLGRFL